MSLLKTLLKGYFYIGLPLFIAIAIIYPSSSSSRLAHYNAKAHRDLEDLSRLLKNFYSSYQSYPNSITFRTGPIQFASAEYKITFETTPQVYIIFKSTGNQYVAIAGHSKGNRFYSISSSNHKTYSLQYRDTISSLTEAAVSEMMEKYCPTLGKQIRDDWQETGGRNLEQPVVFLMAALLFLGFCLLILFTAAKSWNWMFKRGIQKEKPQKKRSMIM